MISEQNSVPGSELNLRRIKLITYKVHEHRIEKAWKRFENPGFKPFLIKGWAAAQYYTESSERQFNDVDLVFAPLRQKELTRQFTLIVEHTGIILLDKRK